ncbi:MAG: hypothetical protein KA160_06570 [Lacibacter sp.]|nr:hypothetical protein [Lacibacter sp.]
MFRKIFISIIAVFYISATSGMVMNVHYCMGKISSISLGQEKDHTDGSCDKCGMLKTENHCCKDEVAEVKLNDVHQISSFAFELAGISAAQPVRMTVLNDPEQGVTAPPAAVYVSPPPKTLNKVYLNVRTFLI